MPPERNEEDGSTDGWRFWRTAAPGAGGAVCRVGGHGAMSG